MGDISTGGVVQGSEDDLTLVVSDEDLEVAASTLTFAAVTWSSAPTVSILFVCCGNNNHAGTRQLDFIPPAGCRASKLRQLVGTRTRASQILPKRKPISTVRSRVNSGEAPGTPRFDEHGAALARSGKAQRGT